MVKQYRDIVSWTTEGSPATKDPITGFPIPGSKGEELESKGRYENFKSGNRKEYENKNGDTVYQKGTIYLKKGELIPLRFETVTVTSPEFGEVFKGEILNVYKGQLNTTIAV